MSKLIVSALVLASWVGNAVWCSAIARRAFRLSAADEADVLGRYSGRRGKELDFERLKTQIPSIEATVPGLRYVALVPLALSVTFGLNALARIWIADGTGWMWGAVAIAFLPAVLTVSLLAWEQSLLLTRLKELAYRRPAGFAAAANGD